VELFIGPLRRLKEGPWRITQSALDSSTLRMITDIKLA